MDHRSGHPLPDSRRRTAGRRASDTELESLQRLQELLATAQRIAQLGSWEWDLVTGGVYWSDELYRIYGLEPQSVAIDFDAFLALVHADDRERVRATVHDAVARRAGFAFNHRTVRPDGVERTVHCRATPVLDARGEPARLLGTVQDITEQLEAEATARRLAEERTARRVAEEAHERLVGLLDGVGELFIATDEAWRLTFLNATASQYIRHLGLDPAAILGHVVWQVLPGLERTRFHVEALRAAREWRPVEIEEYYAELGRWFVSRIAPTREGFVSYTRDITEQKRAEASARETLELLQAVVESTNDSIYVKGADGRYVMINSAGQKRFGRPREEILGHDDDEIFPPALARIYRQNDARVLESGDTRTYEEPGSSGDSRVVLSTKSVIRDAAGRVRGLVGISHDITKRKRAEAALRLSEARFRTLVQSIDDVVVELDPSGRIRTAFGRWLERQGLAAEQLAGRTVAELLGPEAAAAHEAPFRRALAGEHVVYEWTLPTLEGPRSMQVSLAPLRHGRRRITGVVGVGREITDRIRAERRQRLVAEASAVLSASLDVAEALGGLARLTTDVLCDLCVVDLLEPDGTLRRVAVAHRDPAMQALAERLRRHRPAMGGSAAVMRVLRDGRPFIQRAIDDERLQEMAADEEHLGLLRLLAPRSSIVVPLVARGRTLGAMSLVSTVVPRAYEPEDVALAEELGLRTALAVDNARLYQDAQAEIAARERREAALRFLVQASQALGGSIDYETTLASVARLAVPALADFCMVDILEADGTVQRVGFAHREPERERALAPTVLRYRPRLRWEAHPVARTLRTGEPTLLAELDDDALRSIARDDAHLAYLRAIAPRSLLAVPMTAHGRILGALTFCYAGSRRRYDETDRELALDLAGRAGLAVDHARLFRAAQLELRQRVEAEAELRRWAQIFEHAGWGVVLASADAELIEAVNPALAWMHGQTVGEMAGRQLSSLLAPEARDAFREQLRLARQQGRTVFESTHLRADGTVFPVQVDLSLVRDAVSGLEYYAMNVQDLTAKRRAEDQVRQAQKMEALGRLAGGVAHDFNNMLMIILGFSDFLLTTLDRDDARWADADEIRKAAERASALTRQLLAFGHREVLETQVLDLNRIVQDMELMLRPVLGEHIQLVTSLSSALGGVRADRGQIEQVVMNLALNARDAMPQGGRLTIETMNITFPEGYALRTLGIDMPAGDYVLLTMSDTGVGMDAATRDRIFEPFFTTKGTGQNSGLGLATVYGIVTQYGGSIWVDSEPGQGSAFKVCFPRVARAEPAASDAARPLLRGGSETILVVEDEESVRSLAARVLGDQGYTVLQARHGREALAVLAEAARPVDLVLSDVVMPEMSGHELAEAIATCYPNVRVLFMSGYTDNEILRAGLDRTGALFLQKPFSPDSLARKVREVLDEPAEVG